MLLLHMQIRRYFNKICDKKNDISNSTCINRTIHSFIFISVLLFMLKKKEENMRLRYCDGKDKYFPHTRIKDVEKINF